MLAHMLGLAETLFRTASAAATLSRSTLCTSASREVPPPCRPCHNHMHSASTITSTCNALGSGHGMQLCSACSMTPVLTGAYK